MTFILNVDPLLSPDNGPNYFPFDPDIVHSKRIDNDQDALSDIGFEFRFQRQIRAPGIFTGFIGAGQGVNSPANAPATLVGFNNAPYNMIGDGVNTNDVPHQETFPYVAWAHSGRPADAPATTTTGDKAEQ